MSIQRFEDEDPIGSLYKKEDGDYCLYSDYRLLEKEYNQLKKAHIALLKAYNNIKSSHRLPPDHDIIS